MRDSNNVLWTSDPPFSFRHNIDKNATNTCLNWKKKNVEKKKRIKPNRIFTWKSDTNEREKYTAKEKEEDKHRVANEKSIMCERAFVLYFFFLFPHFNFNFVVGWRITKMIVTEWMNGNEEEEAIKRNKTK